MCWKSAQFLFKSKITTHPLGEFEKMFMLAAIGFSIGNAAKLASKNSESKTAIFRHLSSFSLSERLVFTE